MSWSLMRVKDSANSVNKLILSCFVGDSQLGEYKVLESITSVFLHHH